MSNCIPIDYNPVIKLYSLPSFASTRLYMYICSSSCGGIWILMLVLDSSSCGYMWSLMLVLDPLVVEVIWSLMLVLDSSSCGYMWSLMLVLDSSSCGCIGNLMLMIDSSSCVGIWSLSLQKECMQVLHAILHHTCMPLVSNVQNPRCLSISYDAIHGQSK